MVVHGSRTPVTSLRAIAGITVGLLLFTTAMAAERGQEETATRNLRVPPVPSAPATHSQPAPRTPSTPSKHSQTTLSPGPALPRPAAPTRTPSPMAVQTTPAALPNVIKTTPLKFVGTAPPPAQQYQLQVQPPAMSSAQDTGGFQPKPGKLQPGGTQLQSSLPSTSHGFAAGMSQPASVDSATPAATTSVIKTTPLKFIGAAPPPAQQYQLQTQSPTVSGAQESTQFQPKAGGLQSSQVQQQHAATTSGFAAGVTLPAGATTPVATTSIIKTTTLKFVGTNKHFPADKNLMPGMKTDNF